MSSVEIEPAAPRGPVAWMAGNPVAANLIMGMLLVGGLLVGSRIKQEVFPEFDLDLVRIAVPYPGASPEEVEKGILLSIEEAVRGLDGVKEVISSAQEGMGSVTVEMLTGYSLQKLSQDIKTEVDRITSFPEDAERPQVTAVARKRQVISLILYGDVGERSLREMAERVRDRLLEDPAITQADLVGVRPLEIGIEVPEARLRAYGLTLEDIAARLRASSIDLPGSGLKTPGGEILVRVKERRDWGREFAEIPLVAGADGTEIRLGEIAAVIDGFRDTDQYAEFNGKPAVRIDVYRVGEQTPISVASAVKKMVAEWKPLLPPGLELVTKNDFSDVYRQRISLLLRNGAMGLVLVLVLLGLFLEARLAFWVTMGIPVSFLGSMLVLPLFGVSINMISVFAFIIALGIVVDDAIVVGENVYHYHQQGMSFGRAAVLGAREVAMPVNFSVLTNMVAFVPMLFIPGTMGKIFLAIPLVVISVFAISLLESLFILPAHLGHGRERSRRGLARWLHERQQRISHGFLKWVRVRYGTFLNHCLHHRYLAVAAGLAVLLVALGYVASGRMGFSMFPRVESDFAMATAVLPYGSPIERSKEVQDLLLAGAREVAAKGGGDRLMEGLFAEIGGSYGSNSGGHVVEVRFYLTPPDVRPLTTSEVVKRWREAVGGIPGVKTLVFQSNVGGPGSGAALSVDLSHSSIDTLELASRALAEELRHFPKATDIDDGFQPGKVQLDFKVRPEGRGLGLRSTDIARQVRSAYYGAEAIRQQRGRNEIRVMVRLPDAERRRQYSVENLMLRTPAGGEIALREAAEVSRGRAYTVINRRNGRRIVTVSADVDPPSEAPQIKEALQKEFLPPLMARFPGLRYSFEGRQADIEESMASLRVGLLMAVLGVYVLLAIPFRSYLQPAIIMVSIPFGIVGAILGHLLMGYSLSVISVFGIVALSGVVVNDALVLIDFANRWRQDGHTAREAIWQAGVQRFRPIMLTTLTTFGGLAPMIFETSRQAQFVIPMAISLGFGILASTVISLILVPSLYIIAEDVRGAGRRKVR